MVSCRTPEFGIIAHEHASPNESRAIVYVSQGQTNCALMIVSL